MFRLVQPRTGLLEKQMSLHVEVNDPPIDEPPRNLQSGIFYPCMPARDGAFLGVTHVTRHDVGPKRFEGGNDYLQ